MLRLVIARNSCKPELRAKREKGLKLDKGFTAIRRQNRGRVSNLVRKRVIDRPKSLECAGNPSLGSSRCEIVIKATKYRLNPQQATGLPNT